MRPSSLPVGTLVSHFSDDRGGDDDEDRKLDQTQFHCMILSCSTNNFKFRPHRISKMAPNSPSRPIWLENRPNGPLFAWKKAVAKQWTLRAHIYATAFVKASYSDLPLPQTLSLVVLGYDPYEVSLRINCLSSCLSQVPPCCLKAGHGLLHIG